MRARILVTDGETPAALAVVRSLSRAGHRVHVLAFARQAAAAASAGATAIRCPDPVRDPGGFTDAVSGLLTRRGFDVVVPVTDTALLLLDLIRHEVPARTVLAMPDHGVLEASQDKLGVLARAEALGIPVLPRRVGEECYAAPLPAVVKPGRSRRVGRSRIHAATAIVVHDRDRLAAEAGARMAAGLGAYTEPWIPGGGYGVFLLLHHGRVRVAFAHRRIREASILGGPSAVAESVAMDPMLLACAVKLARELGVEGPFMAEFRGRPGEHVLLEVNARYWGSLALPIACGVDFPALHLDAVLGYPRSGPAGYPAGVRVRNLGLDLRRTAEVLRGTGARTGGIVPAPGRLRALSDLLFYRGKGMIDDPRDPAAGRAHAQGLLTKAVRHE